MKEPCGVYGRDGLGGDASPEDSQEGASGGRVGEGGGEVVQGGEEADMEGEVVYSRKVNKNSRVS